MSPGCVALPYDHKEHTINDSRHWVDCDSDCDLDHVTADEIRTFDDSPKPDDDRPVTVTDLLDLHLDPDLKPADFRDLYEKATGIVTDSFWRIENVLAHRSRLSPEERAEFDRRTT